MQQVELNVQGISCGSCIPKIEGNVGKLNGIESVKVHLADGKVNVKYDSNVVSLKEIEEVIKIQGYVTEELPTQGQSCH